MEGRMEGGVGVGAGIGSSQAANVADLRDLPNEETEDDWVTAHAEPTVPARVQHVSAPLTTRQTQASNVTGGMQLNARREEENLNGDDESEGSEDPPNSTTQFATLVANY
ncbi:hypothetical protein HK104_005923 [Borealophlyctis nickersoniae]|nr:hypothetical protein HK104_005923 [Borealophlyctis nickersoniae]